MKLLIIAALIQIAFGLKLPPYLKSLTCSRNDPNLNRCLMDAFEKARPYFVKGVKELSLPPMDPFELPFVSVNRTVNELVSINSVLRNVKVTGMGEMIMNDLQIDSSSGYSTVKLTLPQCVLEMEYDVGGQLLQIPLHSKGFFEGRFNDTQMAFKFSLKEYNKDGATHYRVDRLKMKGQVGDGWVRMTASNPQLQFGADLISNFFNSNPRAVFDAVNPIWVEFTEDLFSALGNQVFAQLPLSEIFVD